MKRVWLIVVVVLFSLTLVNAAGNCSLSNNITITNYNNITLIYFPQTNITVTVSGITSTNIYSPTSHVNVSIDNKLNITTIQNMKNNVTVSVHNNVTNIINNNNRVNISVWANFTNIFAPHNNVSIFNTNNANVRTNITNRYIINITNRDTITCPSLPSIPACPACPACTQTCSPKFNLTCPGFTSVTATPVSENTKPTDWVLYGILAIVVVFIIRSFQKDNPPQKSETKDKELPPSNDPDFSPERKIDNFALANNSLDNYHRKY